MIKNTPHTARSWRAYNMAGNRILKQWRVMSECPDQPCAICRMDESLTGDQEVANAKLIAAAPDLIDALDYLLAQTVDMDLKHGIGLTEGEQEAREMALSAIAKARGQS